MKVLLAKNLATAVAPGTQSVVPLLHAVSCGRCRGSGDQTGPMPGGAGESLLPSVSPHHPSKDGRQCDPSSPRDPRTTARYFRPCINIDGAPQRGRFGAVNSAAPPPPPRRERHCLIHRLACRTTAHLAKEDTKNDGEHSPVQATTPSSLESTVQHETCSPVLHSPCLPPHTERHVRTIGRQQTPDRGGGTARNAASRTAPSCGGGRRRRIGTSQ